MHEKRALAIWPLAQPAELSGGSVVRYIWPSCTRSLYYVTRLELGRLSIATHFMQLAKPTASYLYARTHQQPTARLWLHRRFPETGPGTWLAGEPVACTAGPICPRLPQPLYPRLPCATLGGTGGAVLSITIPAEEIPPCPKQAQPGETLCTAQLSLTVVFKTTPGGLGSPLRSMHADEYQAGRGTLTCGGDPPLLLRLYAEGGAGGFHVPSK
jgi:hypothetical protein